MFRRIDTYLEALVDEERFAFYQAVGDFAEKEIGPSLLTWERQHCLLPFHDNRSLHQHRVLQQ